MKYLALIYSPPMEGDSPAPGTPEFDAMMQPWVDLNTTYQNAGVMLGGEALMPTSMATSIRKSGGSTTDTMDGPFAETKEHLGGYYLLDCADLDEALGWAAKIPAATYGRIEVRPVMELPDA